MQPVTQPSPMVAGLGVESVEFDLLTSGLAPEFPSRAAVAAAASAVASLTSQRARFGEPVVLLRVTPGSVKVRQTRRFDDGFKVDAFELVDFGPDLVGESDVPSARGEVVCWSRRSRARMVETLAELDYDSWLSTTPGNLGMITLTLGRDWLSVAPDGRAFKGLVRAFRQRWERAIGPARGLWKLEFQRRGAPHIHMLAVIPAMVGGVTFEDWARRAWAEVVGHVDPRDAAWHARYGVDVQLSGEVYSSPRRVAVYFLKHSAKTSGSKEYQHRVPDAWQAPGKGPGRFWGIWGLERAASEVVLSDRDFVRVRRILRKVAHARDARIALVRHRALGLPAPLIPRASTQALKYSGGWVLVNDGPRLASDVYRALSVPDASGRGRDLRAVQREP